VLKKLNVVLFSRFDATRAIREYEAISGEEKHVPIIAMTAFTMPEDHEKCLKGGHGWIHLQAI
jgi:CheY-like chemotaxis protein